MRDLKNVKEMKIIRNEYCVIEPQEGIFLIEKTKYLFGKKFWICVLGRSDQRGEPSMDDEETSFATMNCALDYIKELRLKELK